MIFIRLSSPDTTTVFVYPTPDNVKHLEYVDKVGNCFEYKYQDVDCPYDDKLITNIPPQMGKTNQKLLKLKNLK